VSDRDYKANHHQQKMRNLTRLIVVILIIIVLYFVVFITHVQRFMSTDIDNKVILSHHLTIEEKHELHLTNLLNNQQLLQQKQLQQQQQPTKQDAIQLKPPIDCNTSISESLHSIQSQKSSKSRIQLPDVLLSDSTANGFHLIQYSSMKEALSAYTIFHNKVVSDIKMGNIDSCRILVVEPKEGWGNVIRAITSSLYVAMITGRALFIDLHPFPFDRYFKQVNIEWQWLADSVHNGISCKQMRLDISKNCKECWPNLDRMKKNDLNIVFDSKDQCYRVVTFSPLQEWLVENPFHRGLFRRFNSIQDWQDVYDYFIAEPTDLVKKAVEPYEQQFKEAIIVYGVHIRSGKGEGREDRFLLPTTVLELRKCTQLILQKSLESGNQKNQKPLFFITTDNVATVNIFESALGKDYVVHTEGMAGHSIKNPNFELKAVVDWYLLTKVDVIFATIYSSFSKTAHEVHNNW
jgi:hypothetical protein